MILLVYNADTGFANTMLDMAHKVISPSTYSCDLCQLTHGAFGQRKPWKAFLEEVKQPMEFLHRDEFKTQYGEQAFDLPVILQQSNGEFSALVDAKELNEIEGIEDLIKLLKTKLGM